MKKNAKKMTAAFLAALTVMGGSMLAMAESELPAQEDTQMIGMANPWTEMDSLEALNEAADVALHLPGVMGVTDVHYRLLNDGQCPLAELQFCVNGMQYILRASGNMEEDISGVWLDNGETAFAGSELGEKTIVTTAQSKMARWFNLSGQYVMTVLDDGQMDEETFAAITDEMMDLTDPFEMVRLAEGDYYDITSRRAILTLTALENDSYAIEVHWADSAFVDNVWTMTADMMEDGELVYHDCVLRKITTLEDGTVNETEANLIPDGSFETADGILYWTGAAEENCRNCVFQPIAR